MKAFACFTIVAVLLVGGPAAARHYSGQDDGKQMMKTDSTKHMKHGTMMKTDSTKHMKRGNMMKDPNTMHGESMHRQMMGREGMGMREGMQQGMQGWGMSGNMHCVLCLVNQEMMWVNRLPDMQSELSLTDDQVTKLTQLRTLVQKQKIDLNAEVQKKQIDLKTLMEQGASGAEIRKSLQAITNLEVDSAVATYETAMKMKSLLTAQQKEKLDESEYSQRWMGGQHMMQRE